MLKKFSDKFFYFVSNPSLFVLLLEQFCNNVLENEKRKKKDFEVIQNIDLHEYHLSLT